MNIIYITIQLFFLYITNFQLMEKLKALYISFKQREPNKPFFTFFFCLKNPFFFSFYSCDKKLWLCFCLYLLCVFFVNSLNVFFFFVFSFSNFIIILTASSLLYFCFHCCGGFIFYSFSPSQPKRTWLFVCLNIDFLLKGKIDIFGWKRNKCSHDFCLM